MLGRFCDRWWRPGGLEAKISQELQIEFEEKTEESKCKLRPEEILKACRPGGLEACKPVGLEALRLGNL